MRKVHPNWLHFSYSAIYLRDLSRHAITKKTTADDYKIELTLLKIEVFEKFSSIWCEITKCQLKDALREHSCYLVHKGDCFNECNNFISETCICTTVDCKLTSYKLRNSFNKFKFSSQTISDSRLEESNDSSLRRFRKRSDIFCIDSFCCSIEWIFWWFNLRRFW